MSDVQGELSMIFAVLFLMLMFKDMSGRTELHKISEELKRLRSAMLDEIIGGEE